MRFIEVYAQKFIHPTTGDVSLPHFIRVCNNSFGVNIGTLRADLGPELVTTNLSTFCKAKGVRQEFSVRATPMQHGQVERANRSIGEGMKAMLLQSDLHNQFWAEAAAMFVYVHNLLPREHLGGKCHEQS